MFSRMQLLGSIEKIASRFDGKGIIGPGTFMPKNEISGFDHAPHPILLRYDQQFIWDYFQWGLVPPDWRKMPEDIWNHTISAKLEYVSRRYAWQKVSDNRALIPATAYFEYHWNDPKGNSKTKYIIRHASEELFALAGLFSLWRNPQGNVLKTFAICTTEANEIMQFVHNKDAAKNYHRMPIMLNRDTEMHWLDQSIPYVDFGFPNYKPDLVAKPVIQNFPDQPTLF